MLTRTQRNLRLTKKQRRERRRGIVNVRRWLQAPRTLKEIRQHWAAACEDEDFGDPTYAAAVKEVLRPVIGKTKGFHESEIIRVVHEGGVYYVCSTCGGNCGQCAMGDRFARANPHGMPPASMDVLIRTCIPDGSRAA